MRFLFCSSSTSGHLYPAIGVALGLRKNGHEIAFCTDRRGRSILESYGLACFQDDEFDGAWLLAEWGQEKCILLQVRHLMDALRRYKPHVMVGGMFTLGLMILRHLQATQLAVLGLSTYLYSRSDETSNSFSDEMLKRRQWRLKDISSHLNRALTSIGFQLSEEAREALLHGDLFLLRSVPSFEGDLSSLPSIVHLVGDCLFDPPAEDDSLAAWLESRRNHGHTTVYVQQAKAFNHVTFWTTMIRAVTDAPLNVIASTERMDEPVGDLPPNIYARRRVPQALAMPHCSVVLSNGTTTPVLGAIRHRLPCVLIPTGGEGPDVTELACRAGFACEFPAGSQDHKALRHLLLATAADSRMREQAALWNSRFAAFRGTERAVQLLVALAETRSVMRRVEDQPREAALGIR